MIGNRKLWAPLAAAAMVVLSVSVGRSAAGELEQRLPHRGNAVMTVDIVKLLDTPLAKTEGWQSKLISGYADRPLPVPATAKAMAVTAFVHPATLDAIWQAAAVDEGRAPQIEAILQKQGGYLDALGSPTMRAAWSARDVYYVQLDNHTLGILRPGDRQAAARWIGGGSAEPMSPYLTAALAGGGGDAQIVFAIDLTDSVGPGAMNYAYGSGALPTLDKITSGRDELLAALGSVKGVTLRMKVDQQINSELKVDFDQSVDALGANAKSFVIDVMKQAGLYDPQVEKWDVKAAGKTITGSGACDADALRRLMAILSPGNLDAGNMTMAMKSGKGNGDAAMPAADSSSPAPGQSSSPAAASQAYYRAIVKILDQSTVKGSPTSSATWLHAQAQVIQQLPALGVDPMLLDWGDQVAGAFNRASQVLAIGQQNAQVSAAGVATPTASVTYGTGGSNQDSPESRAAFRNAQDQRRQAAQQQRAAAADQALSILNDAGATRGKIRSAMVQQYHVEF